MRNPRKLPKVFSQLARLAVLPAVGLSGTPALAAKVACVGDSITYGHGLNNRDKESYPAVLQSLVGNQHTVQNFGTSGCTLLKQGDKPYWNDANFAASDSFKPDVVIVMLGTNDAKPQNWAKQADFEADYQSLIEHYRASGATVYAALPPPVYPPGAFDIDPTVVANEVVPMVRQIATKTHAPLVDVFQALSNQASLFPDTVHPNAEGAKLIAQTVAAALNAGGSAGTSGAAGNSSTVAGGPSVAGRGVSGGNAGSAAGGSSASAGGGRGMTVGGTQSAAGANASGGTTLGQGGLGSALGGRVAVGGASVKPSGEGGSFTLGGTRAMSAAVGGDSASRGGASSLPASGGSLNSTLTSMVARGGNAALSTTGSSRASTVGGSRADSSNAPVAPATDESGCTCRAGAKRSPQRGYAAALGLSALLLARRGRERRGRHA